MKNMKPVVLRHAEPLAEGYKLWPVSDQWSELLPARIPLRFALFRCVARSVQPAAPPRSHARSWMTNAATSAST